MNLFSKCRLVILDFDGTILNTIEDLADAVNHALTKNNLPNRSLEEVTLFVGQGMMNLITRSVPEGSSEETILTVHRDFMAHYKLHSADKTRPYDGIYELIDALKEAGYLLAVASNKADSAIQDLCGKYFPGCFHYQSGERANIAKKPAPDLLQFICSQLGVELDEAILVGDSEIDIITAQNAHIPCIAVEWGFRSRKVLEDTGADVIVSRPAEILELLKNRTLYL